MIFSDIPVQYIGWRGGVRLMLGSRGDRSACESAHATGAEERRKGHDGFCSSPEPTVEDPQAQSVCGSLYVWGGTNAGVLQLRFRMTAKNKQRQEQRQRQKQRQKQKQKQKQIPYGNDKPERQQQ